MNSAKLVFAFTCLTLFVMPAQSADKVTLTGAGATFPYPIYSKWFDEYHRLAGGVQINYQSIGSGGGIRQITDKTIDFGATDGPMTDKMMLKVDGKLLHVPTVLGAVVPVFSVKGVKQLNLTQNALAGIFLGKIRRWNDLAIASANTDIVLPDAPITVIHRADGSGTTFCFVDFLCKASKEWDKAVGRGTSVKWPIGLGGKGNEGVAGLVKQMPNSIGYVELIYAKQNNLAYAAVENRAGKFVKGDLESITAAAAAAAKSMPADYRVSIANADGEKSYPISSFTWLLIYQQNPGGKGKILKDFLRWMLKDGQVMAADLGYAPLPVSLRPMIAKTIETIQ